MSTKAAKLKIHHKNKKWGLIVSLISLMVLSVSYGAYIYFDLAPSTWTGILFVPESPTAENKHGFIYEVKPGEKIEDTIFIENNFEKTMHVDFYVTDRLIKEEEKETFYVKAKSSDQDGIGLWTKLSEESVDLMSGENKKINFETVIPENTPLGKYEGAIVASYMPKESDGNTVVAVILEQLIRDSIVVTDNPREIPKYDFGEDQKAFNRKNMGRFAVYAIFMNIIFVLSGLIYYKKSNHS